MAIMCDFPSVTSTWRPHAKNGIQHPIPQWSVITLPDEILKTIFQFIPSYNQTHSLSKVCRLFYHFLHGREINSSTTVVDIAVPYIKHHHGYAISRLSPTYIRELKNYRFYQCIITKNRITNLTAIENTAILKKEKNIIFEGSFYACWRNSWWNFNSIENREYFIDNFYGLEWRDRAVGFSLICKKTTIILNNTIITASISLCCKPRKHVYQKNLFSTLDNFSGIEIVNADKSEIEKTNQILNASLIVHVFNIANINRQKALKNFKQMTLYFDPRGIVVDQGDLEAVYEVRIEKFNQNLLNDGQSINSLMWTVLRTSDGIRVRFENIRSVKEAFCFSAMSKTIENLMLINDMPILNYLTNAAIEQLESSDIAPFIY